MYKVSALFMIVAVITLPLFTPLYAAASNIDDSVERPSDNRTQANQARISLEQFEQQQSDLGLAIHALAALEKPALVKTRTRIYELETLFIPEPVYILTDQSEAFIGRKNRIVGGFIDYQESGLTPEGRVIRPMKSVAAVGIRSKF